MMAFDDRREIIDLFQPQEAAIKRFYSGLLDRFTAPLDLSVEKHSIICVRSLVAARGCDEAVSFGAFDRSTTVPEFQRGKADELSEIYLSCLWQQ